MKNRIAPYNNTSRTHPEACDWLTDFMIDLKKMILLEEDYQPFTLERLNEWSDKHHDDIAGCVDMASTILKRLFDEPVLEHADAISCFNGLVIDLKLRIIGKELREITPERIEEADKYYGELCRCRKNRRIYN